MRRNIFSTFLVLGLLAASFVSAEATEITGVSTYTTSSQMMSGMGVTVTFANNNTWTGTWANLGKDLSNIYHSGVSGSDWSFKNDAYASTYDDTFWNNWTLSSTVGIKSIALDGIAAGVIFDILDTGNGTANSYLGIVKMPNSNWTYAVDDAINLTSASPVGDLYGKITLTYGVAGGFTGTTQFRMDTDKTLASETPEPATLTLLGLGLLGFGVYGRKRNVI